MTFASLRPYEFLRNGAILHHLPVRVVGVGGGFEYGSAGPTHHGLEDIGVMRLQPGLTVVAPADHLQTSTAVRRTWDLPGPVYYRLGKDDRTSVPGLDGRFELGRLQVLRSGGDLAIVAMARPPSCGSAGVTLAQEGFDCAVAIVSSVSPPPLTTSQSCCMGVRSFSRSRRTTAWGRGLPVSELVAERELRCRVYAAESWSPSGRRGEANDISRTHAFQHGDRPARARRVASRVADRAAARHAAPRP